MNPGVTCSWPCWWYLVVIVERKCPKLVKLQRSLRKLRRWKPLWKILGRSPANSACHPAMAELKGMSHTVRLLDQISSDNARVPLLITCTSNYIYMFFNTSIQVIPTFTKKIFIQPSFRTCGAIASIWREDKQRLSKEHEEQRETARKEAGWGHLYGSIPMVISNPQKLGYAITLVTYVDMNIYI